MKAACLYLALASFYLNVKPSLPHVYRYVIDIFMSLTDYVNRRRAEMSNSYYASTKHDL